VGGRNVQASIKARAAASPTSKICCATNDHDTFLDAGAGPQLDIWPPAIEDSDDINIDQSNKSYSSVSICISC
jgi:hypothetical protein